MIHNEEIKNYLFQSGADLCGIAGIERFSDAPEGYHPTDVLPDCKSVIVIAKSFLVGTLACTITIPYTIVRNMISDTMDKMAVAFCSHMEKEGVIAIPTGTIGPSEFDEKTMRFRNIISGKHAAQAAGLGVIGKNTLLITPEYGNMVWLSVILTELELEQDPILETEFCKDCSRCINACPVKALGEPQMEQLTCWEYAFGQEGQGDWRIKCHKCRDICPHCLGSENGNMKRHL